METISTDVDKTLVQVLEKISQAQRSLIWKKASEENLSPIQLKILQYIEFFPQELCRVNPMAKEFDLTAATISDAVTSLDKKGFLQKNQGCEDQRCCYLTLTETGIACLKKIKEWEYPFLNELKKISEHDKILILNPMMKLLKNLYDAGVISMVRMCPTCENLILNRDGTGHEHYLCNFNGREFDESDMRYNCINSQPIQKKE